ncbi:DNA repair and recombination protein RAD54B-like isoform X2 [Bactrocera neohumeralis]|uniref:DNA repair and recombination protein RAD54B-like isoform X2 n=1 Tax=Bactrocera neohumeralis TaxID=98809 RepID=UPI002166BA38|nr:DNA repair and recombination protein RAD54B-like isoform X2 [Bactrocera neohumeralis]
MRRSCAPSMLKEREIEKRRRIDKLFEKGGDADDKVSSTTLNEQSWGTSRNRSTQFEEQTTKENNDTFNTKIIFNVVWREMTKKKHKTWDGDGLLEVQLNPPRAVLKDSTGRYMGTNTKFEINNLEEGYQMIVGGREIELLEQITDGNQYFAIRKQYAENRWNSEEKVQSKEASKKGKITTLFQTPYKLENQTLNDRISETKNVQDKKLTKKLSFNVVWREKTTKKNKTWNGDGVFDVDSDIKRGVLKDDKGQELGIEENINLSDLVTGAILLIGDKEIEILEVAASNQPQILNEAKSNIFISRENKRITKSEGFILPSPPQNYIGILNPTNLPIHAVEVSYRLTQLLRPHQKDGVSFLYKCVMGFQNPKYRGCILADEMGLGKTLQCLTLAHTLLKGGPYGDERVLHRVLIAAPSSLTRNWENEVTKWLKCERMYAFVVGGKQKLCSYSKQQHVPFVIASYEFLLSNVAEFQCLKFDMLICDEGHRLKNESTKIVAALRELNIPRRIIITGTPVQNDLSEFYSLIEFVNPGILGSYEEFHLHFEIPLQRGQCPEASTEVKNLAAERSRELMQISETFMLRRLQNVNGQYLPKKYEYICFVQPSELQQFLLQKALHLYTQRKETILKDLTPLQIITVLKKICNHPSLVARTKTPNLLTRTLERCLPDCTEMGPFDSAKLELVQHFLISSAIQNGEKCVLVSNHTKTLNMLQGLCDFLNIKSLRLDGSTSVGERNNNVEKFNSDSDDSLVFLLSAKAGGVGLNLIGASRLVLFDNDWNPAIDAQAISRIWRDGQTSDVHIYRLVTAGCIEEKIFQRQTAKLSLGDCVIQNVGKNNENIMKFTAEDLSNLFCLQEDYSICQTHENLNCSCNGDGENLTLETKPSNHNINALTNWKHYKTPFDTNFLEAACLENASDNLMFIFGTQTE